jgi:hypothetical protein
MSVRNVRPVAVIGRAARHSPAHLSEALDVCLRRGIIPVMSEQPSAGDPGVAEAALGLIDEADLYIGIIGGAHETHDYDRSVTEAEYGRASERGIPRLVFAVRPDLTKTASGLDAEGVGAGLGSFTRLAGENRPVRQAGSLKEFRVLLTEDLVGLGLHGRTGAELKPHANTAEPPGPRKKGGGDGNAKSATPKTSTRGRSKRTFRVFVASPGDVWDERSRMPKVVESLNRTLGRLLDVVIELWRWEADAQPAAGEPQALIDPELDAADVVLVIFWNRFGTPTSAGATGTESEVLRALKRWGRVRRPQVMVYFCQRPALLDRPALEHRLKLLDFRERISSLVLAADYEDVQEFEWRARDDLFLAITRLCVKRP